MRTLYDAEYEESCDSCAHQEDSHYCLLHSCQVKNMNIVRCLEWEAREEPPEEVTK